jgi:hypothetical protein
VTTHAERAYRGFRAAVVALTLGFALIAPARADTKPDAEFHVPFPKFAPRPSATTLYCASVMQSALRGDNEAGGKAASISAQIYADKGDDHQYLRLVMQAGRVMVSGGYRAKEGKVEFAVAYPYKILNDSPEDFFAIDERMGTLGFVQAIALNRVTGTLMLGNIYASLPIGGHPFGSQTFYSCSSTAP